MSAKRPKRTRLRAQGKTTLPQLSDESAGAIQSAINYTFKDAALLTRAMTHPSALGGDEAARHSNQRLEFLGDRVLGLVIAERLMDRFPTDREGDMAPKLNALVNKGACARAVQHLSIGEYVIMAAGEIRNGGRERESTLGDVCESLIGAIYRDGGLKPARAFIERAWAPQLSKPLAAMKNPKSALQEWALQRGLALPTYKVTGQHGPDHAPKFDVTVTLENGTFGSASGTSKQSAERAAAALLLEQLNHV